MNLQPTCLESQYGYAETISALETAFREKGMDIFAKIDHQAAARQAGLTMQPATVIIYGSPKAGTPLMVSDPSLTLQLPLKVLVTELNGKVKVLYLTVRQLTVHSQTPPDAVENTLAKAERLIRTVLGK